MVSTEEEKVPHVDEAEEFATAINYKSVVIYLSEIKGWMKYLGNCQPNSFLVTYYNQDHCNKSAYRLRQLLPLRLQRMSQRLA